MIFRTKSFNINQPVRSGFLNRTQSFSGRMPESIDVRASIVTKEISSEEAENALMKITQETMSSDWQCSNPLDNEQNKWNTRYNQASGIFYCILARIRSPVVKKTGILFFASYFKGVPIGILQFSPKNKALTEYPEVDYLATHCGIRNCGVLLIEYAVNKSQQLGMNGKLTLTPLSGAEPAYFNMGFTYLNSMTLMLNPAAIKNKWYFIEGRYKYKFF
ncbi:hypothetical protein [Xenorhabdus eapokensis]|uniref:N-acetyltransferase n=1 Tax=Xenorhabdus eapokensis TaxID=1873482 RepID=A0A1Q5TLL8_9GAMM|nr:hypothetical protein [Xenorhabdus eapokensis]OKP01133.1 N-acetyltransferase [Xenorhabdus eapokensis]